MATLLCNRENKANTSHFLLNKYQLYPHCQEKVDFRSLLPFLRLYKAWRHVKTG